MQVAPRWNRWCPWPGGSDVFLDPGHEFFDEIHRILDESNKRIWKIQCDDFIDQLSRIDPQPRSTYFVKVYSLVHSFHCFRTGRASPSA